MANTSALLANLLSIRADKNYYTLLDMYWARMAESNSAKLQEQVKYEEKYQNAFDDAQDVDKKCTVGNKVWKEKGQDALCDAEADAYAHEKVRQYDEELSLELAELDIDYDTMVTMYDTLLEELKAQEESAKQATSTAAQDTGLLSS